MLPEDLFKSYQNFGTTKVQSFLRQQTITSIGKG